jgi:hydroxyacylglutathione hydrolase
MLEIVTLVLGPVQTNTYIIADTDTEEAAVIDPAWDGIQIVNEADQRGWQIGQIWVTHAHFDHIGGIKAVSSASNPPIPIALHPEDLEMWRRGGGASVFGFHLEFGPEPAIALRHGQILCLGNYSFEVRHVPGHSRGHIALYCAQEGIMFCGDLIFHAAVGRTDLPGGNFDTLIHSIQTQVFSLPNETRLLPGHGYETTVGFERLNNPFL